VPADIDRPAILNPYGHLVPAHEDVRIASCPDNSAATGANYIERRQVQGSN
jgi:hypothetical protein